MASAFITDIPQDRFANDTMAAEVTKTVPPTKDIESAANDPDFALICAFLQKFAKDLGLDIPNFNHLHQWLINTDEVSHQLRDMHIKLIRKTRKIVHEKSWESALSKFCFSYSSQDGWEIERFGYKKSSLKVKLRILRELLESQFVRNNKFRSKLLTHSANSLRSQPIGRDKSGHNYWLTRDDSCNLRIYQEHLDEEIWRVVATNREELVNLIARLRGNEVVLPSAEIGVIDEDTSSSNSCAERVERPPPPEEQDDSQEEPALKVPNIRIKLSGNKKLVDQENPKELIEPKEKELSEKINEEANNVSVIDEPRVIDEQPKKVKPLIITQSQIDGNSSNSKRKQDSDEESLSTVREESNAIKRPRPSLLDSRRATKPNKYFKRSEEEESSSLDGELDEDEEEIEEEDIDSAAAEEGENEEKEIEEDDDDDFEEEVGEAIEDPPVYVRGNGNGKDCKSENSSFCFLSVDFDGDKMDDVEETSDVIEAPIMYFYGEGDGADCMVGNNKTEENVTAPQHEPKATFFFGEPGCLKLSPIKITPPTFLSNKHDLKNDKEHSREINENLEIPQNSKNCVQTDNIKITDAEVESEITKLKNIDEKINDNQEFQEKEAKEDVPIELNGNKKESFENEVGSEKLQESNKKLSDEKITKDRKMSADNSNNSKEEIKASTNISLVPTCSNVESKETKLISILDNSKNSEEEGVKNEIIKIEVKKGDNKNESEVLKLEELKKPASIEHKLSINNKIITTQLKELEPLSVSKVAQSNSPPNKVEEKIVVCKETPAPAQVSIQNSLLNRKRRLAEFSKPVPPLRQSTSESELDPNSDQHEESNSGVDNDVGIDDIGGKRLKMRPKSSNMEARKKFEAQLGVKMLEQEETTSSSGDEEARRPRKMITPKKNIILNTPITIPIIPSKPCEQKNTPEKKDEQDLKPKIEVKKKENQDIGDEKSTSKISITDTSNKKKEQQNMDGENSTSKISINDTSIKKKENQKMDDEKSSSKISSTDTSSKKKENQNMDDEKSSSKISITDTSIQKKENQNMDDEKSTSKISITDTSNKKKENLNTDDEKTSSKISITDTSNNKKENQKMDDEKSTSKISITDTSNKKKENQKIDDEKSTSKISITDISNKKKENQNMDDEKSSSKISISDTSKTLLTTPIKTKPTLSEIIEKKLKKTPPNTVTETTTISPSTNSSIESIFALPKKSPITKPLKKNLLSQLRESDDEAVPPRKRTTSETANSQTAISSAVTTQAKDETDDKNELKIDKTVQSTNDLNTPKSPLERKPFKRKTPERQRKRQSSEDSTPEKIEEVLEKDSSIDGNSNANIKKCKEEHSATETEKTDSKISNIFEKKEQLKIEANSTELSLKECKKEKIKSEPLMTVTNAESSVDTVSPPGVGRRSSRRCAASVVYAELPQPKRTRSGAPKKDTEKHVEQITGNEAKKEKIETEKDVPEIVTIKTQDKQTPIKLEKNEKPKNETKSELKVSTEFSTPENLTAKMKPESKTVAPVDESLEDQIKTNIVQKEKPSETEVVNSTPKTPGPGRGRGVRKKREVDMTNIIESTDAETPVRQSRRIAQQKIREEAERRKLEEIALRTMKQELKKKKKAEKEADPTVFEPVEESSPSSSESEQETKKKSKKKCPGKDGWSSGSEEVEEPEEEEEPHHYESDPGSPLFKSDHEFSPESDLEDETQVVPMKRARTARKEDALEDEGGDEEACQKCGKSDHPEWILLCDSCDKGYHCSCLSPVIFYIPEGDWFCPPCQQEQLIVALEKQLQEFDQLVERKRIEHEEEKRLAEEAELMEQTRLLEEEEQRRERRKQKQKKRHRNDSSDDVSDVDSESADGVDNNVNDVSDNDSKTGDDDKETNGTKVKSSRHNNKSTHKHLDNYEKHKRQRRHGKGRNRRRKAAERGARRRRRLNRDSGSDSANNSSNSGSASDSSSGSSSDSFSDSDDEPIYKLRKRRQINVSYRLNEYDDLINSALKKEMDEVAGAGNLGRGKDITTIIEADKEEKARLKHKEDQTTNEDEDENVDTKTDAAIGEPENDQPESEDDMPIKFKVKSKGSLKKKSRKLTTLDISSEEDNASDEDFKTSSFDDEEEEEDTSISASTDSDTSLEIFRRRGKGGKKKQRKAARRAARQRRKDRKFVVEESDDDEPIAKPKKKRKEDSDYTESETDDDELSENSENIDSADLCDDSSSEESDGAWHPTKRKKPTKSSNVQAPKSAPKPSKPQIKKPKQLEYSDDDITESEEEEDDDDDDVIGGGKGSGKQPRSQPLIPVNSSKTTGKGNKTKTNLVAKKKPKKKPSEDEQSFSDSEDSTRRTRGRRYAYLEDFDDDSSDGGIKPGVKRPDTPPEEREKFIKKQEEIKRMLAEKNAEGAKLAATPRLTPIKAMEQAEKDKRSPSKPGQDSLSTVPLSVIRQAKVLDIDYLQRKGEPVGGIQNAEEEVDSEFDDADLPDDLPEDMDEDAIARMVEEEEEFGTTTTARDLPAPDEILRTSSKIKTKEATSAPLQSNKSGVSAPLEALAQMQTTSSTTTAPVLTTTISGLQEPTRKRLPMPTLHPPLLRHQYSHPHTQSGNIMLHSVGIPRHPPSSHLLQNALSAPLGQPLNRNFGLQIAHNAAPIPMPARQLLTPSRQTMPASASASTEAVGVKESESKPRGRRKKITPLRDPAQKQATAVSAPLEKSPSSESLIGRASVVSSPSSVIKSPSSASISVAQPPQLFKPTSDVISNEPQASVITRMPHLPPNRLIFPGADVARFYSSLPPGAGVPRPMTSNSQRQIRGPPLQIAPGMPPGASNYGPPHARHPPPHLNPYRPTIYGNPNYRQPHPMSQTGPSLRVGAPPTSTPDYLTGPRPYPPYGYYPPPPPLTTTHHPPPVSSVIVAAPPSSGITSHSTAASATTQVTRSIPAPIDSDRIVVPRPKSPLMEERNVPSKKTDPLPMQQKKLMTLEAYTPSNAKSPLAIGSGESSGSQPETADDSPTTSAPSQSKAGEFSGLVSYFSSQHDDYNT